MKLSLSNKPAKEQLNIIAEISQLDGVITLLKGNVGYSILPKHCVQLEVENHLIKIVEGFAAKGKVENQIYIVQLEDVEANRRTGQVMKWFREIIAES